MYSSLRIDDAIVTSNQVFQESKFVQRHLYPAYLSSCQAGFSSLSSLANAMGPLPYHKGQKSKGGIGLKQNYYFTVGICL